MNKDKEETEFICPVCSFEFKQAVGTTSSTGKHSNLSTQVICPNCDNFMKTWGER